MLQRSMGLGGSKKGDKESSSAVPALPPAAASASSSSEQPPSASLLTMTWTEQGTLTCRGARLETRPVGLGQDGVKKEGTNKSCEKDSPRTRRKKLAFLDPQ